MYARCRLDHIVFVHYFVCVLSAIMQTQLADVWEATHAKPSRCFLTITRLFLSIAKVAPFFHVLCLNCLFLILSAYLCCHKGLRQCSPTWGCLVFVLIQAQGGCDDESVSTGGCKQRAKHSNADISHISEKRFQRKACSHELARAVTLNQAFMLQI